MLTCGLTLSQMFPTMFKDSEEESRRMWLNITWIQICLVCEQQCDLTWWYIFSFVLETPIGRNYCTYCVFKCRYSFMSLSLKSHCCLLSFLSVQTHPGRLPVSGHGCDSAGQCVWSADVHAAQRDSSPITTSCVKVGTSTRSRTLLDESCCVKWTLSNQENNGSDRMLRSTL